MKKKLLLILKITLGLILLLILGGYFFTNSLKPTYQGEKILDNLHSKTTVYYDDYGIPHIYAENEEDAMRSLGFVHAQDRLWQMELLRRISPGKLSELFGELALENDMLFAGLGIEKASVEAIEILNKNSRTYKMAIGYLDGINQFIDNGPTPIEFYILGIDKEKFDLKDTYNIIGYMAFSFAMAHKTDPLLSNIHAKLGDTYLKELGIEVPTNSTFIQNYNKANEEISLALDRIIENSPVSPFIGSNSWIVSGKKSKSGKVLFANDPHIAFSSPSVWYEAHISTPEVESYGYYLGGVPFPLLSHNRDYAFGITMFENDDIDFYQEENHPKNNMQYLYKNSYRNYEIDKKTIKIKGKEDLVFEVKSSTHGPVMNDMIKGITSDKPITMSWIYTKMPNQLLTGLYEMSRAKNIETIENGVAKIHAPGLNVMYGDAQGNISWWAAAQLYKLPENTNSKLVLDGRGGNEIEAYLPFTQNPQAHNPPWNYVYSANNQPDSIAGMLYPGYYLPEDRAKRIVTLLESKNNWTKEDFMEMLNDTKSSVSGDLINVFSKIIKDDLQNKSEIKALKLLEQWDSDFKKSSVAATIYTKFIYLYMKNTFEDELGETIFKEFVNTHIMKRMIAEQMQKEQSIWWDDVNTSNIEDKKSILQKSFSQTITALENQLGKNVDTWTWNRVHTLEHEHPIGKVTMLRSFFNVGTFEVSGTREVINNLGFPLNNEGIYNVNVGPSTRRVIDFSDIENSMSILPTGNSGNPLSKFYRDQAEMYANGKFRKMKLNKEEIKRVSSKLTLAPTK